MKRGVAEDRVAQSIFRQHNEELREDKMPDETGDSGAQLIFRQDIDLDRMRMPGETGDNRAHCIVRQVNKYSIAIQAYNKSFMADIAGLKSLQENALDVLISGVDCVCCLPTGYGKSLIYELLPFVVSDSLVFIIAPLNAIITQQVAKLGDSSMCLSRNAKLSNGISSTVKYIFSHPEDILQNKGINELFRGKSLQNRKVFIVIDEAHCILEWGDDFRPDFKKLSALRSLIACQVLALSATITDKGRREIKTNLLMKKSETVCASPTKDNIKLLVLKRPSSTAKGNSASSPYHYIFTEVLKNLKEQGEAFPITVIYCKSIQWIGYGYELAREMLGEMFYDGERRPENARVVMFHSSMEGSCGKLKNLILSSLQKPPKECSIRLIIASVALGMGADLKHVNCVIHAGPPTSLETYVQEIGRCGRSGNDAQAILYYNNNDLGVKHMQSDMKDYCRNNTCKRELINKYFGVLQTEKNSHCCSICTPEIGLDWDFDALSITGKIYY